VFQEKRGEKEKKILRAAEGKGRENAGPKTKTKGRLLKEPSDEAKKRVGETKGPGGMHACSREKHGAEECSVGGAQTRKIAVPAKVAAGKLE